MEWSVAQRSLLCIQYCTPSSLQKKIQYFRSLMLILGVCDVIYFRK